mmetsp:Transcript_8420/g.12724  ORF Transcript_8420/g.12724 Transcript_8420/m.12724 type:complete len:127 (-) Transcript_8420:6-386(-)
MINKASTTERDDLLSFLFMLSYCTVGEDYPLGALTEPQLKLAEDFIDLGLFYKRKASSSRFYTTDIAVNLIFGADSSETPKSSLIQMSRGIESNDAKPKNGITKQPAQASRMTIIVETNYQVTFKL